MTTCPKCGAHRSEYHQTSCPNWREPARCEHGTELAYRCLLCLPPTPPPAVWQSETANAEPALEPADTLKGINAEYTRGRIEPLRSSQADADRARDEFAMVVFKELVPYLDNEQREHYAKGGKSTTYKAAVRAWDAALEWARKGGE